MNYAVARQHMVDSQVRTNKVTDERLIDAIRALQREIFVPEALRPRSYLDDDVELVPGRFLMEPMVTARLIQTAAEGLMLGAEEAVRQVLPRHVSMVLPFILTLWTFQVVANLVVL